MKFQLTREGKIIGIYETPAEVGKAIDEHIKSLPYYESDKGNTERFLEAQGKTILTTTVKFSNQNYTEEVMHTIIEIQD